eukprot:2580355-Amphidinium_carterae.1
MSLDPVIRFGKEICMIRCKWYRNGCGLVVDGRGEYRICRRQTCLHYAAANVHIECLRILVNTTKGQK